MKNILIIAFEFYPYNTGGSHRPFRMAKFLIKNGFNPVIITQETNSCHPSFDQTLVEELKSSNLEVVTIPIKEKGKLSTIIESYYFNVVGDTYRRWKKNLLPVLNKLIIQRNINSVLITLPPFSLSNILFDIKAKHGKLPVYIDLRDAWSNWNVSPYASFLHYKLTLWKERSVLNKADKVFITSKVTLEDLMKLHPKINQTKFLYIPNSFDKFNSSQLDKISVKPKPTIHLGYFGSFYYHPYREELFFKKNIFKKPHQWFQYAPIKESWLYRSPYFILKMLSQLNLQYPSAKNSVVLHLVGNIPFWLKPMIKKFNLNDSVILYGRINKNLVHKIQKKMDFLIITSSKRIGQKDYSIAGKSFEYLSLQKPIIGFLTDSAQKDLLESTGALINFNPDEISNSMVRMKNLIDFGVELKLNKKNQSKYLTSNVLKPLIQLIK